MLIFVFILEIPHKKNFQIFFGNHIELDNPIFLKTTNYLYLYKNNNSKNRDKKQRIKLGESELRHMISESVKRVLNESKNPKGELEDALNNVLGILHAYNDTEFGIDKKDFETLYETISDITNKINNSYDHGPYEGEPYYFDH